MRDKRFSRKNPADDKILACYLRISDEDFDLKQNTLKDESVSISAQRQLIHRYIQENDGLHQMNAKEFLDDGYSGTNFDRPAIQEIFRLLSEGKLGGIIVKDMSRFGRNYIETGRYIEQVFPLMGIRFISINDCFDSIEYAGNTPGLELAFKNVIYDYYSKDLSTKVKSSKKIQQQRGDFVAAKPPYGYIISPVNRYKLEVEPESAEVVKTIFHLTLSGDKPAEIAQKLNELHIPTPAQRLHELYGFQCGGLTEEQLMKQFWKPIQITKILHDETMTGATVNNRVQVKAVGCRKLKMQKPEDYVVVNGTHEAIIDKDTFLQAAEIIRSRKTVRTDGRQKNENFFNQKIYCGHCGCRLRHEVHTRHSHAYAVYYCPYARPSGGGTCRLKSIKDDVIKEYVLRMLQVQVQLILDKHTPLPKSNAERLQSRLRTISRLSEQNKVRISNLYEEYRAGKINREEFIRQKEAITRSRCELERERSEIEKNLCVMNAVPKKTELESLLEVLKLKELTQKAVDLFVSRITAYSSDSIEIVWKSKDLYDELCNENA